MRVLVEALAVWQDAESWAYFADVTGRFVLDVALPGSDRSRVPATIDESRLTAEGIAPVRVPALDLGLMGFHGVADVFISRIRVRGASDWLIVTDGTGDGDAETRLAVYVQAVIQAMNEVNAIHSSRLTWAMLEHLLSASDSLVHAAQGAIDELAASVDASAWFTVFQKDGTPLLAVGDLVSVLSRSDPTRTPSTLVLPVQVVEPYQAIMGIRRSDERPLTGRDEQLLRLAATTMGTWLNAVTGRLAAEQERRSGLRSFDHVLKQRIDDAGTRGAQISLIVISLGADAAAAQIVHECVAQIRRQLRPADMAGRVASGRIGVLLPDTPPEHARIVVERLRQLLASPAGPGPINATIDLPTLSAAI